MQYDYGDHSPTTLALKVRRMDENMNTIVPKPVAKVPDDLGDIDEPADKAHLILSFFDTLDLIDQFEGTADPARLLHMFRLFLYSIYHNQHANYVAANPDSSQFFGVFKKLCNIREQNHNFECKFVGENNMEPAKTVESTRKVTLFPIPSIVRKRLGLE